MTCEWRQRGQASTFLSQSGSEWVQGAPIEHVREIKRSLEAEVADAAVHVYPGAGHGFFRDGIPSYNGEAAEDAGLKALVHFIRHLCGASN